MSKNTALMIVDVQVGMYASEEYKLYNGEKVLQNIAHLLQKNNLKEE